MKLERPRDGAPAPARLKFARCMWCQCSRPAELLEQRVAPSGLQCIRVDHCAALQAAGQTAQKNTQHNRRSA